MNTWTHLIEVEIPETPEDWIAVSVCLTVHGTQATRQYFDKAFGNWLPGDPAELELVGVEIQQGNTWRKALPASPLDMDNRDQAVLDAVDDWWDTHADACWDSFDPDGDEADYRRDAAEDR
jgi:hypothetical protein